MILEEKRLYLLLYLFFEISRSDGLVEFQKTNFNDNVLLLKILQSIDAVSSDAYLFDVTIKLLQSVCACMHETLHKTQKIFGEDINLLHSKYEKEHENDINLYKQIYNNTCIDLQHELFNKIRRHGLRENNYYAVTKNINYYIDVNMKAVMKRVIFASLIKKENNRIFKIERHNLFKNKLLFDDHNENRVIIIITLYPFSNKTLNEVEEREVSEKEIEGILLKDSPIDIDIINTVKMPENKEKFKVVTAKKCVLYSIYLFITQSLKRNTIKSFRFLRRKGTIKIYIDSITNQDFIDFPYPCCESSILLTECSQRIFEEHDAPENFVKNKTDKTKLDSYKDIVSKIKLLVKQYSNKINNNNQHIDRPNTLLLVSKPNTNFEYEIVNNSQRIIETDHNTITPKYSDLQSLNSEEIIYPINITTTILKEYIMPKKLSYLAKTSHSKTTINKASSSKIFSGVILDPILTKIEVPSTQTYENTLNIIYNNWISNQKLAKKRTTVWREWEEKISSPMNFVFYSKWPEQYTKNVQDTLTDMTFYSIKISTEPNEIDTLLNYKSTTFRTQSQLPSQPYTLYETKYLQEKQNKSQIILENLNKNNRLSSSLENKVIFDSNNKTYANEVENKPDNNKIGLILEILNQHVTPKENKSFKKISPLDFIKYQEKLQNVNKKSTAMDVSIIPRAKASNINKKIVFMLDKVDTKPNKNTNRVLLETLDKHVTFEQSTSYKQTSPFHLIKDQQNLQHVNKRSTATDVSIKFSANLSNTNKKMVYTSNNEEIKPDKNAKDVLLGTLNNQPISEENKRYKEISPLDFIKYQEKLQNVNKKSTAIDVSIIPRAKASNINKKIVYMLNKVDTKPNKNTTSILLETLDTHVKSNKSTSYKQTSPFHLIKHQGNLQNVKKISTAIDISIKQNANEKNFSTKIVYIPNKVNTKPDTNANSVHLETLDEHIISVKNKSYKQTSPLHLIKHHGNLHHVNKRSTAMDVSNKPTTNLSNTNKKMVYMSNKEETKHDKDAKDVLLETLNKHLKSEDNKSYKQTSPLHLIKYQEQEQNLSKSSTDMDNSGKPRANVSNANKKIIYISSKVETIPQNNAKDVLLETIDDNLISEDNNSYKQTSPLHFVKYSEKLRNVNNRSTAIDFSIKPRSNARNRINKNVSLLKKVETKPEKNTNILLETLDKYVTSEQNTSHKQTSLHLMKDQGIQQNIKKRSTVKNISVKENANESNVNTKIVFMPNTEETKPDKNANYVQLQTQDERIISEQNRSYTQTSTFHSIKQEGNLQKINERSTAVEIFDKLSSNAGKTNKKLSHMLNKVKIKPDKSKNGILLEKMDEHLISVQNKSHKQTSPLHLNIYEENVKHVKKRSTTVEISIKPNANVSNINKTNIYMPNKVTIKLDKNTKAVILKTLDENLISNENKSYKQTSPSHYIKYRGNLQKHSKKATATSIETDVSVINFTKLPLQGIKQTKTNLFSATMLDNNTLSSQTLLSQLDPLNFIEIIGKKQKIKQKVLGNASFYKSDLVNVFNNISNSSKNEPYVTPRSTFKTLNVTFSTDSTVKNFKIKSKFLPRFVSNKVTNFGNTTVSNYIDIGSRDSEKEYYRITTQSPPKVKAVWNNKITDQNNQLKLPTFTTLFRSNINNNVTTPLVNNDKVFINENYKSHYTIQRPMILNKYIKNKNSIWQYIVTSTSEKYEKSKFNDSGLSEKPNPTKRGRVIDFHYFVVTERTMGFTNKEDRKSQLPSSFITLLLPQTKDITNLSVFNEEDTVKIKVNDKSNINNKIIPITTTKFVTKLFTNKSSDNHIDFTKTTILNPQILLVPERNYSSTTSANTHKMFTRSEVMYAPYIGTTEISDQITPMIRVPQVFVSYHNTNKQSITTSNISHREIDTGLKRVPSTRKEGKNKKSILLPILFNKIGMTPSLGNDDIMILSTGNSKIFTFLNTNKRLQIREKILLDDENNIKANASSTEPAVISSTINQHMKVKKAYQYALKINNLTEDNVASQSIKDHNQILNTKKEIYLTTSTKTITTNKKPGTKTVSEKNLYTASSINPQIKIVMIGTESLNNFTKLIPLETFKNTTSRYDNGYARTENNSRINFLKSNMESEIRLQDNKLKTNNNSKIFNLLHKGITLNHDTNPYRRHFKNTGANKNVSTITTVNSITANMQKNVDTMLQKSQNDNYVRTLHNINLKQNKQKETINNPISRNNLLFFSQTIPSQIKDSRQRITDTNSITFTKAYETIKSLNKIMEMKTLHLLLNNYQNNQVKTESTNNESYAFNKTSNTNSKYESINSYLTTPASTLPLSQNNTNFIGEIDLKTDLITIIHTRKVFNKSEQHHKSESVIEKNNKQYNTSAVTKIPSTVNRFEIHKSQSTIPVLFNTTSIITYPILGKYLQNRSEAFKILNNRTVTSSISPKLQTHNGNTSITSILLNKNIDKAGNKPVIAKMKGIPKEKQPYKDNKIFDLRYIEYPSQVKQSKLYLEKHLNKYRRFNVNDITTRSDKPLLRHTVTKLTKIDLRYNNKSDDNFSENLIIKPKLNKNKNRNQIIDTAFQNLAHGKNKNYILETLTNPRKSASDMQDFNYTMLKSTTSKENIITANMNKSVSIEKNVKKWDVFIKKSHSTTQSQLFSSKRRENKEKEILISKSSLARITDSSFNKFKRFKENDNTAKMTHLSLSSPISSFVAYDNSDTSTHSSFSQKTVNENHIMESVPLDRKSKVVQKYYTTPSSVTASMFHAFVKEIQSQFNKSDIIINTPKTTPNLIEDYKHTNSSLFIISYENTKNKIKNFNKKQHDKGNFRQSTSAFDVLKLKDQNLNKKSISSYKSNKNILDTKDISESKIPVTNKTKIHSNLLKNVKDFYNGSGFRDTHDIKVQINNNFKIKTYQKIYIKTNFKSSDMKSLKKRKTIKYNTYKPTERYLETTRRMTFKNNFNERNKQTYKPKVTFVDTRIKNIPTTSILDKKLKFRKETVATNRFNDQVKPKTLNRKQLNENTLLNPFDKTNLYPLKKLPTSIQKKVLRRIQFPSKGKDITVNTKDFFQRRDTSKNKYFRKPLNLHPKNQIEKPVTFKPKQYIIRPMFDQIDGFNLKDKYFRPKPLLIGNNNFYREDLQTHPRSNSLLLRQKVNYIKDTLPTPVEKRKVSNALERPSYLPPNRKPTFLRDRIDSIRNYLNNADFIETTQFPIKNYVDAETEVAGELYKDPLFYFRKSGWYDSGISDDFTSTKIPKRTRRQRKTIFFLSPSVTDWWLDDMYLKIRLPVPINSNPGMVFPRKQFAKIDEVADLAALYIDDLLDYKEMLDRGELPQERATSREKGQPLCMEQFYRLLDVCRIPEVGKDRLELPSRPSDPTECEELIIVACRNYFYPIPVKASDRGRLTPGEIQAQLLHAMVDAAGAPPAPRIGLLTSMNRDQWAKAREQLIKDETNRCNLDLISRALCVVCVDEAGGDVPGMDPDTNALLRAMHGAGTAHHSANRWFDKTVQLIISSDGTVGMCYEHSPAEGVAVVRLAERALARADVAPRPAPPPALLPAPGALQWTLGGDTLRTIERAGRELDRAILDLDLKVYTYRGYGREFMKTCRTSPDVYIQLALQYAYYKMYGYLVSTYESASLRRFHNGRVDNIRSAHAAAQAWASAMTAADAPHDQEDGGRKVSFNLYGEQKKLELFEEAARKQTSIMEANIQGRGIDNHLLGLREAAREALGTLPEIFTDQTYTKMIEFKLSTSQVATTTEGTFMGYGAVVPDGYGCSYNPKRECVIFCISSFVSSSVTNTEAFRQALEEALDSMKLMFQNKKIEG